MEVQLGLYAYGFRYYDPVIARFTGVDPIADQFAHLSVYNYASNDPIKNIDLHGLQGVPYSRNMHGSDVRWSESVTQKDVNRVVKTFSAPLVIAADIFVTKGRFSKEFVESLGIQLAGNVAAESVVSVMSGDDADFSSVLENSFNQVDFADIGLSSLTSKKYSKLVNAAFQGSLKGAVDITNDDLKVIGFNKDLDDFTLDAFVGVLGSLGGKQTGQVSGIIKKIFKALDGTFQDHLSNEIDIESVSSYQEKNQTTEIDNTRVNIINND